MGGKPVFSVWKGYIPERYKVYPGEPGGKIITEFRDGKPTLNSTFVDSTEYNFEIDSDFKGGDHNGK